MGIGDKVRAADEAKAEAQMNADGKLSGRQFKELVSLGMGLSDARELAASGIPYDDIKEIADAHARNLAMARSSNDIGDVLTQNAAMMEKIVDKARNRRSESYNGDFPFPNISAFNPDGDAKPKPPLVCETWEGYWHPKEHKAEKGHPCEDDQLSKREVRLLNALDAGVYKVTNKDDEQGTLRVHVDAAPDGRPLLKILAYPYEWVSQDGKNKKPSVVAAICEIFGLNPKNDKEITAWLDAKESESVAA